MFMMQFCNVVVLLCIASKNTMQGDILPAFTLMYGFSWIEVNVLEYSVQSPLQNI